jgi:hypothetical protein
LSGIPRIGLAALIALAALFLVARLRYPGKAPVRLQAEKCDRDLWNHVIEKERLTVLEECTAVEGRVVSLSRASDGDLHIALDPEPKSVLNLINAIRARGELVVEIICEHTPAIPNEKATCADFHQQVTIPQVGDRVRVTGAYVTDRHYGWNEVHPVTRIEILR